MLENTGKIYKKKIIIIRKRCTEENKTEYRRLDGAVGNEKRDAKMRRRQQQRRNDVPRLETVAVPLYPSFSLSFFMNLNSIFVYRS
jgi:hypothetical protein